MTFVTFLTIQSINALLSRAGLGCFIFLLKETRQTWWAADMQGLREGAGCFATMARRTDFFQRPFKYQSTVMNGVTV